jgi:hypothetical protein
MMSDPGSKYNTGQATMIQQQLHSCCQYEDGLRFLKARNDRSDTIAVSGVDTINDDDENDCMDGACDNRYQRLQVVNDVVNEKQQQSFSNDQVSTSTSTLERPFSSYFETGNVQRTNLAGVLDEDIDAVNLSERDRCCSNNSIAATTENKYEYSTTSVVSTTGNNRLYNEDELVLTSKLKDSTKKAAFVLANQITVKTSLTFPEYKNEFFYRNSKSNNECSNLSVFPNSVRQNKDNLAATTHCSSTCSTYDEEKEQHTQRKLEQPVDNNVSTSLCSLLSLSEQQHSGHDGHDDDEPLLYSYAGSTSGTHNVSHFRNGMILTTGQCTTATQLSAASTPTTTPIRKKLKQFLEEKNHNVLDENALKVTNADDNKVPNEPIPFSDSFSNSSNSAETTTATTVSNDEHLQRHHHNLDQKTERQQPPPTIDLLEGTLIQSTASYDVSAASTSPTNISSHQQVQYPTMIQGYQQTSKIPQKSVAQKIPTTTTMATPAAPTSVSHVIHNPITGYSPSCERDVYGNIRRRRHEIMGLTLFSYSNQYHDMTVTNNHGTSTPLGRDVAQNQHGFMLPRPPFEHSQKQEEQRRQDHVPFQEQQSLIPFLPPASSFDSDYFIEHRARKIRNELFQRELLEIAYEAQRAADEGKEVFSVIPSISYRNYVASQQYSSINVNKNCRDDDYNTNDDGDNDCNSNAFFDTIGTAKMQHEKGTFKESDEKIISTDVPDHVVNNISSLIRKNEDSINISVNPLPQSSNNGDFDTSKTCTAVVTENDNTVSPPAAPMSSSTSTPYLNSNSPPTPSRIQRRSTYSGAVTVASNQTYSATAVTPSECLTSQIKSDIAIPHHRRRASLTPQQETTTTPSPPISKQSLLRSVKYCGTAIMEENVIQVSASDLRRCARKKQLQQQHQQQQQLMKTPNSSCKIPLIDLRDANEVLPAFANLHGHVQMHMYRNHVTPLSQLQSFHKQTKQRQQQHDTTSRLLRPLSPLSLLFSKTESSSPRGCNLISAHIQSKESTTNTSTKLVCSPNPTVVSFYDCQSATINMTNSSFSLDHQQKQQHGEQDNRSTIDQSRSQHKPIGDVDSCGATMLASTCKAAAQEAADTLCANQICVVQGTEENTHKNDNKDININTDSSFNVGPSDNMKEFDFRLSSKYPKTRSFHTSDETRIETDNACEQTQIIQRIEIEKILQRPEMEKCSHMNMSSTLTNKVPTTIYLDPDLSSNQTDNDRADCSSLVDRKGIESPTPLSNVEQPHSSPLTPAQYHKQTSFYANPWDRRECATPLLFNKSPLRGDDVVRICGTRSPGSLDHLIEPRALFDAEIDDDDDDYSTLQKEDDEHGNVVINVSGSKEDSHVVDVETQLSDCKSKQQKEITKGPGTYDRNYKTVSGLDQSFGSANDFVTPARLRKLRSGRGTSLLTESNPLMSSNDYPDECSNNLASRITNVNGSIADTTENSSTNLVSNQGCGEKNERCGMLSLQVPSFDFTDELPIVSLKTNSFDTGCFKNDDMNFTPLKDNTISSETTSQQVIERHSWDNVDADSIKKKQFHRYFDNKRKIWKNRKVEAFTWGGVRKDSLFEHDKPLSNSRSAEGVIGNALCIQGSKNENRTKLFKKKTINIDCGMFSVPSTSPFLLNQETTKESKSADDRDGFQLERSHCNDEPLLPSTTWSGFVARKRNDAISHCKSVLDVHDRTNKSIRAAVRMISDNLSPVRKRSNDDDWSSMQKTTCSTMHRNGQKQRIMPEENDEFLSNFMYCPKSIKENKIQPDGNDELKIEGERDAIIIPQQAMDQFEPREKPSRYPCSNGMYGMADFRQDYCCGATDNYDTLLNSLRKQNTSGTDRSKSSSQFVARNSTRISSLHIIGPNQTNHTNASNSQSSPFSCFERSMADPESWVDAATEKIDSVIYQLMGGNGRIFSNRRRNLSSDELRCGQFEYHAPLLKKSINSTTKP